MDKPAAIRSYRYAVCALVPALFFWDACTCLPSKPVLSDAAVSEAGIFWLNTQIRSWICPLKRYVRRVGFLSTLRSTY
jgi:hypothetical protein